MGFLYAAFKVAEFCHQIPLINTIHIKHDKSDETPDFVFYVHKSLLKFNSRQTLFC